ncbi:MAG: hypothetical protein ABI678_13640 [Kofleriaceae bacterium]
MNPPKAAKSPPRHTQTQLLQRALRAAVRCTLGPNEDREASLEAIDGIPLEAPGALRTVYATLAGCTIVPDQGDATDIFDDDELAAANGRVPADLPGALFFARDGVTGWYCVDTTGELAGTAGAVLWVERRPIVNGYCPRGHAVRIARDVAGFLHAAARGELSPRRRPSIDDTDAAELGALLEHRRERWFGAAPRDVVELFEQGIRLGFRITGDLEVVLSISDGMALPYAHVVLWPANQIERAGQADGLPEQVYGQASFPTGLWIGTRGDRRLLCASGHTGWRNLVENTIVAVARGERLDDAPVLGRLGTLVRTWVG